MVEDAGRVPKVDASTPPSASGVDAFPVVGVGASAGGLEAFTDLLSALPARVGVALLVVQHLDPKQQSRLVDILARSSKMPVVEAARGALLEPDHVYVMPPNTTMKVKQGAITLQQRPKPPARVLPIDLLFRSLADEYGSLAVGVVLSGTGTDGVLGLGAIRDAGGLAYAEDPATAEYDGMPKSAIESGVVDAALDVSGIAQQLVRLGTEAQSGKGGADLATAKVDVDDAALGSILDLVHDTTGLDLSSYRKTTLLRRISRRMLFEGSESMQSYLETLRNDPAKVEALYRDVLVNMTRFFRDPAVLDALKQQVFPRILKRKESEEPFRIWVPGCSKGQEAYSIAMTLVEFLENADSSVEIQMFASDVNELDVEFARSGVYPHGIASEISPERLVRFFVQVPGGYQIARSIREMCVFATHDVTKDPPFSKLDLVSLRNVLIYMERSLQEQVIQTLHYALEPGGYLLLGSSETVGTQTFLFDVVDKKNRIYLRKPGARRPLSGIVSSAGRVGFTGRARQGRGAPEFDVFEEAEKVVRGSYQPTGVLLTADLDILQFRGDMGPYLAPAEGPPELRVSRLVAPGLSWAVESAAREAGSEQAAALRHAALTLADGGRREIDIEAVPIVAPSGEHYFLVLFRDRAEGRSGLTPEPEPGDQMGSEAREAPALMRELDETRRQLEAVVSERESANADLRAVNEKYQSSNEELRTINEEFQTAQEELQSTNEELTTLNDELRNRNAELGHLADDLTNVIDGVEIPILILAPDLTIRRFAPQAGVIANIVPADVGRPLTDLNLKVDVPDISTLADRVLEQGAPTQADVRGDDGRWHSMRIRPYRTTEGDIDGVVIAFIDIDGLRRSTESSEAARQHAEAVLQTVRQPFLALDADLSVVEANDAYYAVFNASPSDTIGRSLYELGQGQWDAPALRGGLDRVVSSGEEIADLEIDQEFAALGRRIMRLDARRVKEAADALVVLLAIEDVTVATRRQHLTLALNDISMTVASTMDLDQVLERVLRESSEALGAFSAALLGKQGSAWVVKGAHGLAEGIIGTLIDGVDFPVDVDSLHARRPVLLADAADDASFRSALGVDSEDRAAVLVPIVFRDETIGALSFHFHRAELIFTEAEEEFGRRLGSIMALAVESASLYAEQREIADTLQSALLTLPTSIPRVDFGYLYRSATKAAAVGGDFYDLFELDGGRVGVLIGDVSGKGVRAATLTALVKNTIRAFSYSNASPAAVMKMTNEVVLKATPASVFVTVLFCVLDTASGSLVYCSAGHTTGLIRRVGGAVELLEVGSALVGAFETLEFRDGEASIEKGDVLVVYTDGVTEAKNSARELFGEERVIEFIRTLKVSRPKSVPKAIFKEVLEHADGNLSDDVAIVALTRKGSAPRAAGTKSRVPRAAGI